VANHLGLDFDLVELLPGVDTDDAADHLGDNNHVTEVRLDEIGLLVGPGLLLGLAELLDQAHRLALEAAVEATAGAGVHDITELLRGEVEEPAGVVSCFLLLFFFFLNTRIMVDVLVEVNTPVGKLAELAALLQLCWRGYLSATRSMNFAYSEYRIRHLHHDKNHSHRSGASVTIA
jgi:hypothetical protein